MKKYKYIDSFPKPFLHDLVNNRCLPIIGAGFSKNADIPSNKKMLDWDELGRAIADDIQDYKYTNAIDAISAFSHEYSRINLVEKLSNLLLLNIVKPGKTHKAFCELAFDIVCTTNIEHLLEQGYDLMSKYYKPIINENQLSISNVNSETILIKLHGDLYNPDRLIVTEEDYDGFLKRNPMLSTYLANLLIVRTPLFIGYSLDDTDFRQIWQLIKDRLGNLRRQAYVLKVNCSLHEKARFERRGVKVINIEGNISDYPQILEEVFVELKDFWEQKELTSTVSEEATLAELALPSGTNNRLCFFSIPIKLLPFYKKHIFPLVSNMGLVPISADDIISVGDNWMAKVTALINKAEYCVVDLSSQNTIYELGIAINNSKLNKKILIIRGESMSSPNDINNFTNIIRPDNPYNDIEYIVTKIEDWFKSVTDPMSLTYEKEPKRLLDKKEYKAAVISAMTLLEVKMKKLIYNSDEISGSQTSFNSIYSIAKDRNMIDSNQFLEIKEWGSVRNKLVHSNDTIKVGDAKKIVNGVYDIICKNNN